MNGPIAWNRSVLLLTFLPCFIASPALAALAEIVSLTGKGEYRGQNESIWRDAKIKQSLDGGNFVRTGDLSAMALLFSDKTQIRLSQNSMFQIKGVDPKSGDTTLNLRQGRAWTQAKNLPNRLLMETPTAIAAIHGTDWEMEVDADGRARLTVLHGEVEFYNEQGSVSVRSNEQAVAEKGKAPVKLLLQNPSERVQWVTSYAVEASRYAELRDKSGGSEQARALREIAGLIDAQNLKLAHERLLELASPPHLARLSSAVPFLLLADFAIYGGDLNQAENWLRQGKQHFPDDVRLDAQLARVALYRDNGDVARAFLKAGLAKQPDAAELKLAQGEVARFDGDARLASAAYLSATELAPNDARGWHGLGVVESEREDVKKARPNLLKALSLNEFGPGTRGELATLETFANNLDTARKHYDLALQAHPDDYVALTGLGLLQLKSGDTETALETLLRASVIEPKYARAVIYTAIAYYQLGRHGTALETLARASELDRRDPMPHQLASQIYTDLVEPGRAIDEARMAMRLMPYLKSLNQLANDQKGAANLGNALAQFGLEDWAMNYAQESYNPFWAGSHLFLADRYAGTFNKQSELMQGYLTDPTAFGASNRFQTLLPRPGTYLSAGAIASRNDDLRFSTPSFVINGYANTAVPLAWFVEGMRTNVMPGAVSFDGSGSTGTAALGLAPREDLGVFLFANSFGIDVNTKTNALLGTRTTGGTSRLDLGVNYKFSPMSQSWLKIGAGDENSRVVLDDRQQASAIVSQLDYQPRSRDLQYRHSLRQDADEWTWGLEHARMDTETALVARSGSLQIRQDQGDADKSWSLYLANRHRLNEKLLLDAGLFYQDYRKTVSSSSTWGGVALGSSTDTFARKGAHPALGFAYTPAAGEVWRLAYQKWLRPIAPATLSPVSTAGVALDDQAVLPGGELQRLRFQFERELSAATFASLFLDAKRVNNLGEPGSVLNQGGSITDIDRLRNQATLIFRINGELLEQSPVFLQGRIASAGASLSQRLSDTLTSYISYVRTQSENTSTLFAGFTLPYMPRNRLTLGTSWAGPQRLIVQVQAVYRSSRYTDEGHGTELAAGWDAAFKLKWQSADKRWLLEGYALNLVKKDTSHTVGVNAVWRY